MGWPVAALSAHTDPVVIDDAVPSTTASWPLPWMSASAGLPPVRPSNVSLQTGLHAVSKTFTVSSSLAPGKKLPVPVAMP